MSVLPKAKLMIMGGPFDGCGISLSGETTTIGRDPANDIIVEHMTVSRRQAKILAGTKGYWIQDVGSSNGTVVNGQRLGKEPHHLRDRDQIQIGIQIGGEGTGTAWEFRDPLSLDSVPESRPTDQIPLAQIQEMRREASSPPQGQALVADATRSLCEAFRKNPDGSWTCKSSISLNTPRWQIEVSRGTSFVPGRKFLGVDVASWLEEKCA